MFDDDDVYDEHKTHDGSEHDAVSVDDAEPVTLSVSPCVVCGRPVANGEACGFCGHAG